jgi:hypothetical protein
LEAAGFFNVKNRRKIFITSFYEQIIKANLHKNALKMQANPAKRLGGGQQ